MRLLVLAIALVAGCAPTRETPQEAFARLAPCMDEADARCLFGELDRDSQWSAASVFRLLAQMRAVAERSYPAGERAAALGAWQEEAAASDPAGLFAIHCAKHACLERLAQGFGAVARVTDANGKTATVETTRGALYAMARAGGDWGLSVFRDELEAAKIRLGDNLAQVKRNAAAYDEQRAAGAGEEKAP
ncbi:MAG: hypothetical protein PHU25_05395 [Deltaproteobacteria bacterium]|nr:hypothetical protein [Deltaproteobacteria bacterium]